MSDWNRADRPERGALIFGAILVVVGLAFLVAQVGGYDLSGAGWPAYVIVPGVALLVLGFLIGGEGGLGAAIPGGIVTTVGLVLAFQNATGSYGTWSYMWALVAPGSVGVTLFLYGLIHGRPDLTEGGLRTAAVGGILFIAFGLFFENVVHVGANAGSTIMADAMPVLAIVLGVLIVLTNLLTPRPHRTPVQETPGGSQHDRWTSDGPSAPPPPQPPAS